MHTLKAPVTTKEFTHYYQLRWKILNKPKHKVLSSEQDEHDQESIHRMIIDHSSNVLAVGRLRKISEGKGEIDLMVVDESHRKQGLGRIISCELEQEASQLGLKEIQVNVTKKLLGFYKKLGYEKQADLHETSVESMNCFMKKTLTIPFKHELKQSLDLQEIWHQTIPLSKAMNLQISYYDRHKLVTTCDKEFNQNLHHTMFAGSIYTLATLTGWGWVYLTLKEQEEINTKFNGDIVLAEANIRYHSPIKGLAYGKVIEQNVSGNFDNLLLQKKARIHIEAHIFCGENIAATFKGSYFILPIN